MSFLTAKIEPQGQEKGFFENSISEASIKALDAYPEALTCEKYRDLGAPKVALGKSRQLQSEIIFRIKLISTHVRKKHLYLSRSLLVATATAFLALLFWVLSFIEDIGIGIKFADKCQSVSQSLG